MQPGAANHRRIPARTSTSPAVAALFVLQCDDETPVMTVPRLEPQIVVRFGPSARAGLEVHALGAGLKVRRKDGGRGHGAVIARLRLGTSEAVLGTSAASLAHRIVPLDELWGVAQARRLVERLGGARDIGESAHILDLAIAERAAVIRRGRAHLQLALDAAGRLAVANVSAVAAELSVSARHLRRVFHEAIGVSPKTYTRLARFHRAVRAARSEEPANWATIAVDAGYYDQAHLIADFRAIAGAPPRAFVTELRSALSLL